MSCRHAPMTVAIAVMTVIVSVPALLCPGIVEVLEQDPAALSRGEWWRMLTPIFVQGYGIGQFAFNLVGIVLVGFAVEQFLGPFRWLVVYLVGGMSAIIVSSLLYPQESDSGASAAVAALIAVLVVHMMRTKSLPPWPALMYATFFAVYLCALALGGPVAGAVVGTLAIPAFVMARALGAPSTLRRGSCAVVLLGTVGMLTVGDVHGFGLVAGFLIAALWRTPAGKGMES